jgi:hypothetical protein
MTKSGGGDSMSEARSKTGKHKNIPTVRAPLVVALAVAIFGVVAMLVVDHGPWNKPTVQTAERRIYSTTGAAAKADGATVTKTDSKPAIEPEPPGPKPVAPADPETR